MQDQPNLYDRFDLEGKNLKRVIPAVRRNIYLQRQRMIGHAIALFVCLGIAIFFCLAESGVLAGSVDWIRADDPFQPHWVLWRSPFEAVE